MTVNKRSSSQHSEWDKTYKKLHGDEVLWSKAPEIEDFIPFAKNKNVVRMLDAGCGDGKNLSALLQQTDFYCIGCDTSSTALKICEREMLARNKDLINAGKLSERRLREFCLVNTALENTPFLDDHFDAAICIDVINHNREPYKIFHELSRIVRNNGLIYFSLFNIEDEIIQDEKQRKNMMPIPGNLSEREFIYSFVNGEGKQEDYYFRFLDIGEVEEFMAPTGLHIINKKVKLWSNPPHPHFRPYAHTHCNIMVTARNIKA
jgi:SAM-dependent methyltransferase